MGSGKLTGSYVLPEREIKFSATPAGSNDQTYLQYQFLAVS